MVISVHVTLVCKENFNFCVDSNQNTSIIKDSIIYRLSISNDKCHVLSTNADKLFR